MHLSFPVSTQYDFPWDNHIRMKDVGVIIKLWLANRVLSCFLLDFNHERYMMNLGLDGPGIESRWEARFSARPGAHLASWTMGTGSFPGVKCGRGVLLTTHPLLVPRSWKSRATLYLYLYCGAFNVTSSHLGLMLLLCVIVLQSFVISSFFFFVFCIIIHNVACLFLSWNFLNTFEFSSKSNFHCWL